MEKNKVTVFVAGQKLTLITEESEKYVTDIAQKVDTAISSMFNNSGMSREKCAVMAALDFCDDEAKSRETLNKLKEQIKDYIEDSEKLRKENEELKAELEQLKKGNEEKVENKAVVATEIETKTEKESINADDDLSFDLEKPLAKKEEVKTPTTQPLQKPSKNEKKRHNHSHVNPYKERFMQQKNDQKGYTPIRQYSLFEEEKN